MSSLTSTDRSSTNKYGSTVAPNSTHSDEAVLSDDSNKKPSDTKWSKYLEHIITVILLSIASYVGVTLRIYLSYLSQWDAIDQFESIWSQVIGSGLIGYLTVNKERITKVLYIALATGLCGSLTTFSTWNAEASIALLQLNITTMGTVNNVHYDNGTASCITILLLGIGMPVSSFLLGRNIATKTFAIISNCNNCNVKMAYLLAIVVFIISTTSIIIGCIMTNNYFVLFSLLFSPFGTYLRWRLSLLNVYFKNNFPIGTLIANYIGSLILGVCLVARVHTSNVIANNAINGLITGFCGSLTTVSTFISELFKLSLLLSLLYIFVSLFTVQLTYTAIFISYSFIYY